MSSSIWGEKDAGESDLEAFEYSNSEAGLRDSSLRQLSDVYMKFSSAAFFRERALVGSEGGAASYGRTRDCRTGTLRLSPSASYQLPVTTQL